MERADYIKTFAMVAIVLFFSLQRGYGPMLGFLLIFYLVSVLYNALRMILRPEERARRGFRLAIWFVALALVCAVQGHWSNASRSNAETALDKILAYKERTGAYPASLRDVGLDGTYLEDQWRLRYWVQNGKARLAYPMPLMPLSTYEYDFEARKWRENSY